MTQIRAAAQQMDDEKKFITNGLERLQQLIGDEFGVPYEWVPEWVQSLAYEQRKFVLDFVEPLDDSGEIWGASMQSWMSRSMIRDTMLRIGPIKPSTVGQVSPFIMLEWPALARSLGQFVLDSPLPLEIWGKVFSLLPLDIMVILFEFAPSPLRSYIISADIAFCGGRVFGWPLDNIYDFPHASGYYCWGRNPINIGRTYGGAVSQCFTITADSISHRLYEILRGRPRSLVREVWRVRLCGTTPPDTVSYLVDMRALINHVAAYPFGTLGLDRTDPVWHSRDELEQWMARARGITNVPYTKYILQLLETLCDPNSVRPDERLPWQSFYYFRSIVQAPPAGLQPQTVSWLYITLYKDCPWDILAEEPAQEIVDAFMLTEPSPDLWFTYYDNLLDNHYIYNLSHTAKLRTQREIKMCFLKYAASSAPDGVAEHFLSRIIERYDLAKHAYYAILASPTVARFQILCRLLEEGLSGVIAGSSTSETPPRWLDSVGWYPTTFVPTIMSLARHASPAVFELFCGESVRRSKGDGLGHCLARARIEKDAWPVVALRAAYRADISLGTLGLRRKLNYYLSLPSSARPDDYILAALATSE